MGSDVLDKILPHCGTWKKSYEERMALLFIVENWGPRMTWDAKLCLRNAALTHTYLERRLAYYTSTKTNNLGWNATIAPEGDEQARMENVINDASGLNPVIV